MEYQCGLDKCFCYKCGRLIEDGQQKLRVMLSLEQVIFGESFNEVLRTTHIPSVCLTCAQEIYRATKEIKETNISEIIKKAKTLEI